MSDDLVKRLEDVRCEGIEELCWKAADRIEELEAKLAKAVEALVLADTNLTNIQPKIASGLVHKDWVPVFDGYIAPVVEAARTTLVELTGGKDE